MHCPRCGGVLFAAQSVGERVQYVCDNESCEQEVVTR